MRKQYPSAMEIFRAKEARLSGQGFLRRSKGNVNLSPGLKTRQKPNGILE